MLMYECPRCKNDHHNDNANFCVICGLPVDKTLIKKPKTTIGQTIDVLELGHMINGGTDIKTFYLPQIEVNGQLCTVKEHEFETFTGCVECDTFNEALMKAVEIRDNLKLKEGYQCSLPVNAGNVKEEPSLM